MQKFNLLKPMMYCLAIGCVVFSAAVNASDPRCPANKYGDCIKKTNTCYCDDVGNITYTCEQTLPNNEYKSYCMTRTGGTYLQGKCPCPKEPVNILTR